MISMSEAEGLLHHPMMANNYGNFVMYNQNFHPYIGKPYYVAFISFI